MIKVVQGDRQTCQSFVEDLKSRVGQASPEIEQTVRDVIEQVRAGGDSAVKAFSEKFDGWTPENLELSREGLEQAVAECDPAFIQSLRKAAENIRAFHQRQKQQSRIDPMPNGIITGQRAVQRLEDTRSEHLAIVKACVKKDWKAAAEAMYEHLLQSKNATFEMLLSRDDLLLNT